jgi:hypothetical protein
MTFLFRIFLFAFIVAGRGLWAVAAGDAITEREALALLDRWLGAQNRQDFPAYSELYHDRFLGIRRSGAARKTMNRSEWLKDREPMFAKKMDVTAFSVRVATGGPQAIVRFEQRWESPTYSDRGPKELILVRSADGKVGIGREEMLASRVLMHKRPQNMRAWIVYPEIGPVLSDETLLSWTTGPPHIAPGMTVVTRAVNVAALPAPIRGFKGKNVTYFDSDGEACRGSLDTFEIAFGEMGRSAPYFPEETPEEEEDAARAEQLWASAATSGIGRYLVGRLPSNVKRCTGAAIATLSALPAPEIVKPSHDPEVRASILKHFRELSAYRSVQREFEKTGAKGAWDDSAKDSELGHFRTSSGSIAVAAVRRDVDEFYDLSLTAIWKISGDTWRLLQTFQDYLPIDFASNLGGDSAPELVYGPLWNHGWTKGFLIGPDYVTRQEIAMRDISCGH